MGKFALENLALSGMANDFRTLAWETFFASRQRGVSLIDHFPWMFEGNPEDRALTARVDGSAAGLVVLRRGNIAGLRSPIAALGLICTAESQRGRGIASLLIEEAFAHARSARCELALLWTSQHKFYERLGFVLADGAVSGVLKYPEARNDRCGIVAEHCFAKSPLALSTTFAGQRGIPTFARSVSVYSKESGRYLALDNADLPNLLEWGGAVDDVIALIDSTGVGHARFNGHIDDAVIAKLEAMHSVVECAPVNLAMWRSLDGGSIDIDACRNLRISLLDRF